MKNGFAAMIVVLSAGVLAAAEQPSGSKVELKNAQGASVGTATLSTARSGGVQVALDLKNLPPGRHAIHFHESAKCEPLAFESAGLTSTRRPANTGVQPRRPARRRREQLHRA
jgi:Cu-Zn family superoxide dismutase